MLPLRIGHRRTLARRAVRMVASRRMTGRICPVTYFPVATQRQFERNRELVRGMPYERYFDGNLWLHEDVLPAIHAPMAVKDALR